MGLGYKSLRVCHSKVRPNTLDISYTLSENLGASIFIVLLVAICLYLTYSK